MPLDDGNALACSRQAVCQRRAGLAGADDDGVELGHGASSARSQDGRARSQLWGGFRYRIQIAVDLHDLRVGTRLVQDDAFERIELALPGRLFDGALRVGVPSLPAHAGCPTD